MGAIKLLELALFLNLISSSGHLGGFRVWSSSSEVKPHSFPPTCKRIECPIYDMIQQGNGYEIRRYNLSVWISTSPIQDISLVQATRSGFLTLFEYIQGKNEYNKKIEMTAPVITEVTPSDGPFCESSFVVSFYVPKENQADPPPAKGLDIQRWDTTYIAVRQFGGFVSDYQVAEEAAQLQANLAGSKWAAAVQKGASSGYIVAQYNSPFEFKDRVNEIWMRFDMKDVANEL